MSAPAVRDFAILQAAVALGLQVNGSRARCFNGAAHKHGDAHPSLILMGDRNRFRCPVCGVKGDSIDLVRAMRKVGFRDAVQWLESKFGAGVQRGMPVAKKGKKCATGTPGRDAVEVYSSLCSQCYEIGADMPAGRYLIKRGLDFEIANQHGAVQIGNPDVLWQSLLSEFGEQRLHAAGLVSKTDRFLFARHRLLFVYLDDDAPVYFQARDITGELVVKELCLAGLHSSVPYNAGLLREGPNEVYICEGCLDTLSALQLGYPAVGVPGVNGFRREWFDLFRGVRQVNILFDNDEAGRRQAAELRSQFRMRGIRTDAYRPRDLKDVNDLLQQKGTQT